MKNLASAYGLKAQEAETLRVAFEEFKIAENKRLNRQLVEGMRASLERITSAVTQIAKERNFDSVLDISGNSNTGIPVLLYAADALDITEDVIEILGENQPVEESPDGEPSESTEGESPEE
jgi:Skp family chaperone for outer membrane proteins